MQRGGWGNAKNYLSVLYRKELHVGRGEKGLSPRKEEFSLRNSPHERVLKSGRKSVLNEEKGEKAL